MSFKNLDFIYKYQNERNKAIVQKLKSTKEKLKPKKDYEDPRCCYQGHTINCSEYVKIINKKTFVMFYFLSYTKSGSFFIFT